MASDIDDLKPIPLEPVLTPASQFTWGKGIVFPFAPNLFKTHCMECNTQVLPFYGLSFRVEQKTESSKAKYKTCCPLCMAVEMKAFWQKYPNGKTPGATYYAPIKVLSLVKQWLAISDTITALYPHPSEAEVRYEALKATKTISLKVYEHLVVSDQTHKGWAQTNSAQLALDSLHDYMNKMLEEKKPKASEGWTKTFTGLIDGKPTTLIAAKKPKFVQILDPDADTEGWPPLTIKGDFGMSPENLKAALYGAVETPADPASMPDLAPEDMGNPQEVNYADGNFFIPGMVGWVNPAPPAEVEPEEFAKAMDSEVKLSYDVTQDPGQSPGFFNSGPDTSLQQLIDSEHAKEVLKQVNALDDFYHKTMKAKAEAADPSPFLAFGAPVAWKYEKMKAPQQQGVVPKAAQHKKASYPKLNFKSKKGSW